MATVVEVEEEEEDKFRQETIRVDDAQPRGEVRVTEDPVLALEEEWSIEIPEEEMESVKTVGQAIDLVATKLGVS